MKKDKSKIIVKMMFILHCELQIIRRPVDSYTKYTLDDFIRLVANEKTIGDFDYEKEKCYYVRIDGNSIYFEDKDLHDTIQNFVDKSLINFLMVSIILKNFTSNMIKKNFISKSGNDYLTYLIKQLDLRDFF